MALGTPTDRGTGNRYGTSDITIPSFTTSAGDLLLLLVSIGSASASIPDSISGHGTWVQLGSTEQASVRFSLSLWGCISTGATAAVTVAYSTSITMGAACVSVTGADASGTVANAVAQLAQANGYGGAFSVSLPSSAKTTVHFWGDNNSSAITVENVQVNQLVFAYAQLQIVCDYKTGGDSTPTASGPVYSTWAGIGIEIKEAAGGGETLSFDLSTLTLTGNSLALDTAINFNTSVLSVVGYGLSLDEVLNFNLTAITITGQSLISNINVTLDFDTSTITLDGKVYKLNEIISFTLGGVTVSANDFYISMGSYLRRGLGKHGCSMRCN